MRAVFYLDGLDLEVYLFVFQVRRAANWHTECTCEIINLHRKVEHIQEQGSLVFPKCIKHAGVNKVSKPNCSLIHVLACQCGK